MASYVSQRFDQFLARLALTSTQRADGITKHQGVRECLNRHYYSISSNYLNSMLVGSWGKGTEVRPPRDIDVLFTLPDSVYLRFATRPGNKQSQLLQEVKAVLSRTYSTTKMRGDGQVVVVPFSSYAVEVLPAFKLTSGKYNICDTNQGGSYKETDPTAESNNISYSDKTTSGNTRNLIRMLKRWQEHCNVPLKSFWLELLAVEFLENWEYRSNTTVYYDWMVRDFFKYLLGQVKEFLFAPGTYEVIYLGDAWKSKAESAYANAVEACEDEAQNYRYVTDDVWERVFGPDIIL